MSEGSIKLTMEEEYIQKDTHEYQNLDSYYDIIRKEAQMTQKNGTIREWCMCTNLKQVLRDGYSTCSICGGMDAYGKAKNRPMDKQKKVKQITNNIGNLTDEQRFIKRYTETLDNEISELMLKLDEKRKTWEVLKNLCTHSLDQDFYCHICHCCIITKESEAANEAEK